MAFEDFEELTERRKIENQKKLRQKTIIAGITIFVLLSLIGAGCFGYVTKNREINKSAEPKQQPKEISIAVKAICSYTDFISTCESSLSDKSISANQSIPKPNEFLRTAIAAAENEISRVFKETSAIQSANPAEKRALEDCAILMKDAVDELRDSIPHSENYDIRKTADLNIWLSAVISYQQTCIDGFPEGDMKLKMKDVMISGKELSSNALAIVSQVDSIVSMFANLLGNNRRQLNHGGDDRVQHGIRKPKRDEMKPNVIVAKDGSANFTRISDALAAMPKQYLGRYVIYVKEGAYEETVIITKTMVNVTMYGDGSQKTIVTGSKNFVDGTSAFQTPTFAAIGEGFMARAMGFRNTAGPEKLQAISLRVQSDRSIFINCRIEGYQHTLFVQTHRQFYRTCVISGTVDFIFGDAAAVFQNCKIIVRKPLKTQLNTITAQARSDRHEATGIVLQRCTIMPNKKLAAAPEAVRSYLGRPRNEFSRTVVMESEIGEFINPSGWVSLEGEFALTTLFFGEYKNGGGGGGTAGRVKWPGYKQVIDEKEALEFTVGPFLQGDDWLRESGATVHFGLY